MKFSEGAILSTESVNTIAKPLYPGLYGWQVAYQFSDGSLVFCSCFREAWIRYFVYLRDELPHSFLRTHRQQVSGRKHLTLAFSRFAKGINPVALKILFPQSSCATYQAQSVEGKQSFFGNQEIKALELDAGFWDSPKTLFRFENKVCEVCCGRVPTHYYSSEMYHSNFAIVYGAWIHAELIRKGFIDWLNVGEKDSRRNLWNEAENAVRRIVGVPQIGEKFISETILFKTVAFLLKDHEVIHHCRADWLGRQELDIFVPALKLAIEYQGEQHFEPVDAWGGEEGLKRTQERDVEKKRRCEDNGVTLIYFNHDAELSEEIVAARIRRALPKHNL
jgi:hypothetical protein